MVPSITRSHCVKHQPRPEARDIQHHAVVIAATLLLGEEQRGRLGGAGRRQERRPAQPGPQSEL